MIDVAKQYQKDFRRQLTILCGFFTTIFISWTQTRQLNILAPKKVDAKTHSDGCIWRTPLSETDLGIKPFIAPHHGTDILYGIWRILSHTFWVEENPGEFTSTDYMNYITSFMIPEILKCKLTERSNFVKTSQAFCIQYPHLISKNFSNSYFLRNSIRNFFRLSPTSEKSFAVKRVICLAAYTNTNTYNFIQQTTELAIIG